MPLRLTNQERTHEITACDVKFRIISMSIGEKETLCNRIKFVGPEDGAFDRLLDIMAPAIISIEGYESQKPRDVLGMMEELDDLRAIIKAIIKHCGLDGEEAKNSPSSSGQPIPESAGSAAKLVVPEDAAVSTTPTPTDS